MFGGFRDGCDFFFFFFNLKHTLLMLIFSQIESCYRSNLCILSIVSYVEDREETERCLSVCQE